MTTGLAAFALITIISGGGELEVFVTDTQAQASKSWRSLSASDLVGCDATELTNQEIQTQAARYREFENNFDAKGAASVLGRLVAAEHCRHTASAMPLMTGELLIRALSNAIAENDDAKSERILEQLLSLFPMVEPTLARFPPRTVAAWQKARALREAPMRTIDIWTSQAGTLVTDGKKLTTLKPGLNQVTLPPQLSRVWLENEQDTSLVRQLRLQEGAHQALIFLPEFESNPSTGKLKQCAPLCFQVLQILANQTERDIKVTQADTFERILKSGYPIQDHLSILTSPPSERLESNLGIYDFMPLGVAQFSQSRPISGTLWAMSQITLASLSLWQYQKVEDPGLSIEARKDAKTLTNTFAASFYASIAASIVESIVWRMTDESKETP
ncbi:MAG: hypothetical protein VX210_02190 [Myxococcota bacterium]|nr:hypothetical protein [Myxococcota bacterium]